MLPIHSELHHNTNNVAEFLSQAVREIEAQLRIPQPPAGLKKIERKLAAVKSALLIVEKLHITELTQQD